MNHAWQQIAAVERFCVASAMQPVNLQKLLRSTNYAENARTRTAEWVRMELQIRLAHRLLDFHRLPFLVLSNPFMKQTYQINISTFENLKKIQPIHTSQNRVDFLSVLRAERYMHDGTVDLVRQGVRQLAHVCPDVSFDEFVQRFFLFRMERRILIDHLMALEEPQPGWTGCVHNHCAPAEIIQVISDAVRQSALVSYGLAPPVLVVGDTKAEIAFIPDYLAFIVTEILKNAVRATVEFHTLENSVMETNRSQNAAMRADASLIVDETDVPPVTVEICKGKQDLVIRVSDKGGGIHPKSLSNIFTFGYSNVSDAQEKLTMQNISSWIQPDMGGYGFGLSVSRVFARYFGGNIHVQPCYGVGTDVFITLRNVGEAKQDATEFIPP